MYSSVHFSTLLTCHQTLQRLTIDLGHKDVGDIKGLVHLKMKMMSSFTHPRVIANLYGTLSEECSCSYFQYDSFINITFMNMAGAFIESNLWHIGFKV